jgi:lipoate-protein ligase A
VVWDTPAGPAVNDPMRLLDLTLPDAAANLALDEALLLAAEEAGGGEVLRLWETPSYAVVLGAGGSVAAEVDVPACEADGVALDEIPAANAYVLGRTRDALRPLVPAASVEGTSDLAANGLKFSGNAQQRKRRFFLHHGTLLYGFDPDRIGRYLKPPGRQPEYRRGRPHQEFVTNLPADAATLKELLVAEWRPAGDYAPVPLDRARELAAGKYGRDEWNRRR